ncbi:unnamed protein product [Phaeothamnion confervicola]
MASIKRAIVVGDGYAGLTTAICLTRIGVKSVALVRRPRERSKRSFDPGVGIWTNGLRCLQHLGLLEELEAVGRYVGKSGYRDRHGRWLMRPSRPFAASAASAPSLLFVRQSAVITALERALPPSIECHGGAFVGARRLQNGDGAGSGRGDEGCSSGSGNGSSNGCGGSGGSGGSSHAVAVQLSDGGELEADLLIGADGQRSAIRASLLSGGGGGAGKESKAPDPLVYCGYRVVRGMSPEMVGDESFQTWGVDSRFATVPLRRGQVWYATVTCPPLPERHGTEIFEVSGGGGSGGGRGGRSDGGGSAAIAKEQLLRLFADWHDPVSRIVSATPDGDIEVQNAMAFGSFRTPPPSSPSPLGELSHCTTLVGDAAHTLDPILAQGIGVAFEDAFRLCACLLAAGPGAAADSGGDGSSNGEKAVAQASVAAALRAYERSCLQRVRLLTAVSGAAQAVGQLSGRRACDARDALLLTTPKALKSRLFDAAADATLASHYGDVFSSRALEYKPPDI